MMGHQHHGPLSNQANSGFTLQGGNQFMQNKMNFMAVNAIQRGEYEYDIEIPPKGQGMKKMTNIGDSVGSNQSSVVGNYSEIKDGQPPSSNPNLVTSNISVKKSMLKISAG